MKKVALALLILALTVPAMAAVNITLTKGTLADANKVTIGYSTGGEEVRAFALNVAVSDKAYVVGSDDPNLKDYYIFPGSISFYVSDGNTLILDYGNPIAEADVNGGVLETASLYAASDPCGHTGPPASSGTLCSFRVKDVTGTCGPDNKIIVSLTLNTKRGGVVLKDPNVTPTVNLPAALEIVCPLGGPPCWACPSQPFGDATGDGISDASDLLAVKKSWLKGIGDPHGTGTGKYNCCADFTQDNLVDASDLLKLKKNWLRQGANCADISCP
jgi:hypothetical protein